MLNGREYLAWSREALGSLGSSRGQNRQMGGNFLETDFWLTVGKTFS